MQDVTSPKLSFFVDSHQLRAFTQAIPENIEAGKQRAHLDIFLRSTETVSTGPNIPSGPHQVNRGAWAWLPPQASAMSNPPSRDTAQAAFGSLETYRASLAQHQGRAPRQLTQHDIDNASFNDIATLIALKQNDCVAKECSEETISGLQEAEHILKLVVESPRFKASEVTHQIAEKMHEAILEELVQHMESRSTRA